MTWNSLQAEGENDQRTTVVQMNRNYLTHLSQSLTAATSTTTRPQGCGLWVPQRSLRKKKKVLFSLLGDPSSTSWGHFSVWGDVVEIQDSTGVGGVARWAQWSEWELKSAFCFFFFCGVWARSKLNHQPCREQTGSVRGGAATAFYPPSPGHF